MRRRTTTGTILTGALSVLTAGLPGPTRAATIVGSPLPQDASTSATAQPGDTTVLTLERALAISEANNPGYRRALNQLDVSGVESRATWMGQVLPRVSLSLLNTGYDGDLTRQTTDFFGNPIENPESSWVFRSSTSQSLNLSWSIQGKSLFNSLDGLDLNERGRDLAVERASFATGAQVRRQYFAVLQSRELLTTEEAALAALERDRATAERLYRFAQSTRVDVLNAELAVEDQLRTIRQAQRAYDQSLLSLRTTLGDPGLPPFRLEEEPLPLFDPSDLDDDVLVERALAVHPDVRQAEVDLEQARLGVTEAKNVRWPDLTLSYRLGRQTFTREGDALFDVTHEPDDLYNTFGIRLSIPYFNDYFQNRQNEVQAQVAVRNQRESVKETQLQVEQQVRAQLIQLRNQYETLRGEERRHQIAQEALELAREEYRLGTMDFQALDDQVDAERSARRAVISARYGFVEALLNLEDAVGAPVRGEPPLTEGAEAPGPASGATDGRS